MGTIDTREVAVPPRIGVVVVTYESHEVLPGLLESLAEHQPEALVVIVDDASPSGPPDVPGATVLTSGTSQGYAASCNRGLDVLRDIGVRYAALLNPDVRLQGPSLTELARMLGKRRKVGIATGPLQTPTGVRLPSAWGPTSLRRALTFAAGFEPVRMRSAAGTILRSRVPLSDASTAQDDMRVEGHVIGGTMFTRLACLDDISGFDEAFYLYWEDADLCHRARDAGWEVRVLPCTPFVHVEGSLSSVGVDDEDRWTWFVRGATRFGSKHLVPGQAKQLEAALQLGRRLNKLRQRG